jgi:SSS family solute:Na+ symporter
MLTKAPDLEQIKDLTYATTTPEQKKEVRESWGVTEVLMTVVVLGLVLGLYLYFSFWLN